MATKTFPSITPNSSVFGLISNSHNFVSPFNGSTQTIEMPGSRWKADLNYRNLSGSSVKTMQGFLASLRGKAGRFYLKDHSVKSPPNESSCTVSSTANQTGFSLSIVGLTPNVVIGIGEKFSVNDELKITTAITTADGLGDAVITFEPPLRASPPALDPIEFISPTAIMQLDEDSVQWSNEPGGFASLSFSCSEAFGTALNALTWG